MKDLIEKRIKLDIERHDRETIKKVAKLVDTTNRVNYRGKVYEVVADNYCGFHHLYKLRSHFERTSFFQAVKSDCVVIN